MPNRRKVPTAGPESPSPNVGPAREDYEACFA